MNKGFLHIEQVVDAENKYAKTPLAERKEIDESCKEKYGITPAQMFSEARFQLMCSDAPYLLEADEVNDNPFGDFDSISNLDDRIDDSISINKDPKRAIIYYNKDNALYNIDELEDMYNKYINLPMRDKIHCNGLSKEIWGYSVTDMYTLMKDKLIGTSEFNVNRMEPISDYISSKISPNNNIPLAKQLEYFNIPTNDMTLVEKVLLKESTVYDTTYDFSDILSEVDLPYFTSTDVDFVDYKNIHEMFDNKASESDILEAGWNPAIEINNKSITYVKEKWNKWLQENCVKVIDATVLGDNPNVTNESTALMRTKYEDMDLYPVFIVLSYTNTTFGKIIKKVRHTEYTHAGLSLDSDLSRIATFKADTIGNKFVSGFHYESLEYYISKYNDASIKVICVFVNKVTRDKINESLDFYTKNQNKTSYNFKNIFYMLFKKSKRYDPESLSLVCSQFVDNILRMANINITKNTSSNLVEPGTFASIHDNPKVYLIYEGLGRKYKDTNAEKIIAKLLDYTPKAILSYNESIKVMKEFYNFNYCIPDNKRANEIMGELHTMFTPSSIIVYEKRLPVDMDMSGNLIINFSQQLEDQYQEAHKLLTTYGEANITGIKNELCRLFCINAHIEAKIKKMKKDYQDYKKLVDLRARVLNDFKKYFKVVIKQEKDFNFTSYYEQSPYNANNLVIKNNVLKNTGKAIKVFFKVLGI